MQNLSWLHRDNNIDTNWRDFPIPNSNSQAQGSLGSLKFGSHQLSHSCHPEIKPTRNRGTAIRHDSGLTMWRSPDGKSGLDFMFPYHHHHRLLTGASASSKFSQLYLYDYDIFFSFIHEIVIGYTSLEKHNLAWKLWAAMHPAGQLQHTCLRG